MTSTPTGTLTIPEASPRIAPTPQRDLDAAIATLRSRAGAWNATSVESRLALLEELLHDTFAAAPAWTTAAAAAKGIRRDSPLMGEDWLSGPAPVLWNMQSLVRTLREIRDTGRPQPPALEVAPNGQVVAKVYPADWLDKVVLTGFSAEVRLQRDVTLDQAKAEMGRIYREDHVPTPEVALVLGAGNVSCIGPMDMLYQLFAQDRVVLLKMNPVNEHLGPHLAEAFQALIRDGYLRIVYGGSEVGSYLTDHDGVDAIHITGSDKTHDAIVFGPGEEGERRKAERAPRLTKPLTSELGSVGPVIVVPGPWSAADIANQGDNLATMLVNNSGFNCAAARVFVQHRRWAKRKALVDAVRESFRRAEPRVPYYPGSFDRWRAFTDVHPTAEWFSEPDQIHLPFTFIPDLDPRAAEDVMFTTEAFCGISGEVALDAPESVPEYLRRAVEFCNDTLWGTLSASILVHPDSLHDPEIAAAVERAIDDLRYGSVILNHWTAVAFGMPSAGWGAYPGADLYDIQSGRGMVHNTYLLERIEKSVVRGPFRPPVKPAWYHTNRMAAKIGPKLAQVIATVDLRHVPGLVLTSARG